MRILSLASQKGGSGKSTLAGSLAVAARQTGERVVVVDLDPQGSLAEWGRQREAKDIVFREVEPNALVRWVAETRKVAAVSLVIIDTAGTFGPEVDAALKQSDFILVPVRPSASSQAAPMRRSPTSSPTTASNVSAPIPLCSRPRPVRPT